MNALTCVIASDDDVDAASARTGKKEHVRSDRMDSDVNAADAQNTEKAARMLAAKREHSAASLPYLPPACAQAGRQIGRQRRRIERSEIAGAAQAY